jgi:hypothetical protein
MNKNKFLFISLLATSLLVVSYSYLFRQPTTLDNKNIGTQDIESVKSTTAITRKKLVKTLINKFPSDKKSARDQLLVNFNAVLDADGAMAIIDQTYKNGDEELARQLEAILYSRCASIKEGPNPLLEDLQPWAVQNMREYCGPYTEALLEDEFEKQARSVLLYASDQGSLERKLKRLPRNELDNEVANLVINAKLPVDLRSAYLLVHDLTTTGYDISLGEINRNNMVTGRLDFSDTYYAAFDLYGCYRFGGCEVNQFKILQICMISGQCKQGQRWSVYDYYGNALSQNNLENVLIILQYLFDKQIDG